MKQKHLDNSSTTLLENQILAIIREFLIALGNERASLRVSANAALDKDLGLGSLERIELVQRIEKTLGAQLPVRQIYQISTVAELVAALQQMATTENIIWKTSQTVPINLSQSLVPTTAQTIVEVLSSYAQTDPERPHIYLQSESGDEQVIRYGQLFESASRCAYGLLEHWIKPQETVAIMLPTGKEFFYAFFAVLLAGGIPVPIYPPIRASQIEEYARRQAGILRNAGVRFLITDETIGTVARLLKPLVPSLSAVFTIVDLMHHHEKAPLHPIKPSDPALIQYTSGSTGDPKGVLLTHNNLIANIRAIEKGLQIGPTDVIVSWLPLYHDMGLIGAWLVSLYTGIPLVLFSPLIFLTRPERWLWAIHYHRGTISAAPNFAYELCVRRIEESAIEGLDLSSWRLALNGAEAVKPATLEKFINRFNPYGFKTETMFPVYGLAESSVALAFPPLGREPRIDKISRDIFESTHIAQPANADDTAPLQFVGCGSALTDLEIRLVDNNGLVIIAERTEGRLQFRGPSVMSGYYNAPDKTAAIFQDDWCNSGDFAYIADGEIFITGRYKDIIIKAGRNYYPEELETITAEVAGIRKGCVVAFGTTDKQSGTEKIIIIAETKEENRGIQENIKNQITEKMVALLGIPPDIIELVPLQTIPKTSSGKLRRSTCRQAYLENKLIPQHKSVILQIVKVWLSGISAKIKQTSQKILEYSYSAYGWTVLALTLLPIWLIISLLPERSSLGQKICHYWARSFFWLIACPLHVTGLEWLKADKPMILVSNHVSYFDALALWAALPIDFVFVAKQELTHTWIVRTFIAKQKHITVDRADFAKGISETQKIKDTLQNGQFVHIFPEATFTRAVGVRPFKLGAFQVAVETQTAICPIAISGLRYVLPDKRWTLRRAIIKVTIAPPLAPISTEFSEITKLRDLARAAIIHASGEPALDLIAAGVDQ